MQLSLHTMRTSTTNSERTPLVAPAYVFESSISRRYQRRLKQFQCVICIGFVAVLTVSLLITLSYSLAGDEEDHVNNTVGVPPAAANLTLMPPELAHLLQLTWPLEGQSIPPWAAATPSQEAMTAAVKHGTQALKSRTLLEASRTPLEVDTPAGRAQRATATAALVKPLSDGGYAAEEATRMLVNGSTTTPPNVGIGPLTNNTWVSVPYCIVTSHPCPTNKYRSINGTCNNLAHRDVWGVAYTPFRRALPPVYSDGISSPRSGSNGTPLPSARDISVTVHRGSYSKDTSFTVMLAVWGQFIDHDITATALTKGSNSTSLSCCDDQLTHPECFPVRLDKEDPFYERYNVTCMEFVRSASAPTCHFGPREQLNQATSYLDGSAVYGYSEDRAGRLRAWSDGQLRMMKIGASELLPASTDPDDGCNTIEMNKIGRYCFETGDDRANENLHLTTMHLIWAREHNRIATALQMLNPSWSDEKLYQESRRIVAAQVQHITYKEFLPIILGEDVMSALNLTLQSSGYSTKYNSSVDPSIANHFAAAAFRFAHTLLPGLIHHVDSDKGSIEYIHLHAMLFNPYMLYTERGTCDSLKSALHTTVHTVEPHVTAELSNHLFERPTTNTSSKRSGPCGLDLVSLNIQRGRDHGLPAYPEWRQHCGLSRPRSFQDLRGVFDDLSFERISKIYMSVDDIDLYTGALAENPRGRLLGPTLTCLLSDQFLRLKIGDRFWYETNDPDLRFTIEQLNEIRKSTLAGVICATETQLHRIQPRVMQELGATNPLVDCKDIPQPNLIYWNDT